MVTRDPNRLIVIIRDREIMLGRLRKALEQSKADGRGDAFKLNRFVKHHEEKLKELRADFSVLVKEHKELKQLRQANHAKIEQAEVDRLRSAVALWSINE